MIRVLLSRNLRQHTGLLGILSASLLLFQWAVVWVADRRPLASPSGDAPDPHAASGGEAARRVEDRTAAKAVVKHGQVIYETIHPRAER